MLVDARNNNKSVQLIGTSFHGTNSIPLIATEQIFRRFSPRTSSCSKSAIIFVERECFHKSTQQYETIGIKLRCANISEALRR